MARILDSANVIRRLLWLDSMQADGGKGSGNFGHKGRPGQVGGSGGGGNSSEEENSRKVKGGHYDVDWAIVQSIEYGKKFRGLSGNERVCNAVLTRARWALDHRTGSRKEDLYAINARTGEEIARITDSSSDQGVDRSSKFNSKVSKVPGKDIIFLHNHPGSSIPSAADLNALRKTPGATGVIACHNGTVYLYMAPKRKIDQIEIAVAIRHFSAYNGHVQDEKAMEYLSKQLGFEFRVL